MAPQLLNGERRTIQIHFTMSLVLFMKIRETTGVHDVGGFVRRAIASRPVSYPAMLTTARNGNKCSMVFRVTPTMADRIENESQREQISASCFIEACCWEFIRQNEATANCSP
jgi:hypothetical protein